MMGWRAYYGPEDTVGSTDVSTWRDLRAGLVGVVEFLVRPYRKLLFGGDYLWMEDGRWQETGSVWGRWVERPHPDAIRGRALPLEDWHRVRRAMRNDRRWPEAA